MAAPERVPPVSLGDIGTLTEALLAAIEMNRKADAAVIRMTIDHEVRLASSSKTLADFGKLVHAIADKIAEMEKRMVAENLPQISPAERALRLHVQELIRHGHYDDESYDRWLDGCQKLMEAIRAEATTDRRDASAR